MSTQATHTGRWELADVVRAHAGTLDGLAPGQRTATLSGHRRQCGSCGHQEISYNSCRDRHCPKGQGLDEARWVEAQKRDLLPVQYFHVVFTVPPELHALFLATPPVAYALLFAAAAKTIEEVARRRLGAQIGCTAVLHTWTQLLLYHPHIHCIVPGGGLDPADARWIPARRDFFLPVRVLSQVFRGTLLSLLEKALAREKIRGGRGEDLRGLLKRAARKQWVVYSKPPFAGAEQVLAYLGRYAYRIALSNDRLVGLQNGQVTFRWKDRAHGNVPRLATLDAEAFLRRFLLHVLPRRFVRIRHYGFLANAVRQDTLHHLRQRLGPAPGTIEPPTPNEPEPWDAMLLRLAGRMSAGVRGVGWEAFVSSKSCHRYRCRGIPHRKPGVHEDPRLRSPGRLGLVGDVRTPSCRRPYAQHRVARPVHRRPARPSQPRTPTTLSSQRLDGAVAPAHLARSIPIAGVGDRRRRAASFNAPFSRIALSRDDTKKPSSFLH